MPHRLRRAGACRAFSYFPISRRRGRAEADRKGEVGAIETDGEGATSGGGGARRPRHVAVRRTP